MKSVNVDINLGTVNFYKFDEYIKKFLNNISQTQDNINKFKNKLDNINKLYLLLVDFSNKYENYYDWFNYELINDYFELYETLTSKLEKPNIDSRQIVVLIQYTEMNINSIEFFTKSLFGTLDYYNKILTNIITKQQIPERNFFEEDDNFNTLFELLTEFNSDSFQESLENKKINEKEKYDVLLEKSKE